MTQQEINIQDTIKEGLAYHKKGDLNFAIGKLSLAIQLISHQQRGENPKANKTKAHKIVEGILTGKKK